jgi:hypothetical protein
MLILYLTTVASMGEDRRWMYDDWKKNGAHTDEWWEKTDDFIDRAFSLVTTPKIKFSCVKCQKCEVCRQGHIDETPNQEWFRYRL